jgi:DNA-binding CsgD family transcriptional regulator
MNERQQKMIEMHEQGMTYEAIGQKLGISKQRVFQLIGDVRKGRHRTITEKECVYVGIRNRMNENKISRTALSRKVYGTTHPNQYRCLERALKGSNCSKYVIDNILKVTGLTYEEAFKLDGDDNGKS